MTKINILDFQVFNSVNISQKKRRILLYQSVVKSKIAWMVDLNKSFSIIMSFFFIPQAIASDIMLGSFNISFKS